MTPEPYIPDASLLRQLTSSERIILRMIGEGLYDGEIAQAMRRSESTVRYHIRAIKRHLNVTRRAVLVRAAVRAQLVRV